MVAKSNSAAKPKAKPVAKKPETPVMPMAPVLGRSFERSEGSAIATYLGPPVIQIGSTTLNRGLREEDRDFFSPETAIPTDPIDALHACYQAYQRFGIVRNILDMMSDFAIKGIDIINQSPQAQAFAREWAKRVDFLGRSERIAHSLFLAGIAPIRRKTFKVDGPIKKSKKEIRYTRPSNIKPGHIPINYTILDPRRLVLPQTSEFQYDSQAVPAFYSFMPLNDDSRWPVNYQRSFGFNNDSQGKAEPLNNATDTLLFYKRQDHEALPYPITYPVLRNLRLLAKLELADEMALEGAVSQTRVWTLGKAEGNDPRFWMFPNEAQFERLAEIFRKSPSGGTQDVIWSFDLKAEVLKSEAFQFLGDTKYEPARKAICHGYGIPLGLLGGDSGGGYTNNAVSMKTVSDRMEYIRSVLRRFWEGELEALQLALGFRSPFSIVYDQPSLSDEGSERRLLIELFDRGVISYEAIRDRFGFIPQIEDIRVRREAAARKDGKLPPKAGPFTLDYQRDVLNERTLLSNGIGDPESIPPYQANPGGKLKILETEPVAPVETNPKPGVSTEKPGKKNGRPAGSKDTVIRKRKKVVPIGMAAFAAKVAKAEKSFAKVWDALRASHLKVLGKSNLRKLTVAETETLENEARAAFCVVGCEEVTPDHIVKVSKTPIPPQIAQAYASAISDAGEIDAATQRRLFVAAAVEFTQAA